MKKLLWIVPLVVVVGGAALVVLSRLLSPQAEPQQPLGIEDGTLTPCPEDTMNCVDTRSSGEYAAMEPLPFEGTATEAKSRIKAIVDEMPRSELQTEEENYLHYTFSSQIFGFVDDVEFHIDEETQEVHFRSASRLGQSDMGVNRERMEEIREAFLTE